MTRSFHHNDARLDSCPLCLAGDIQPYGEDRVRPYVRCPDCALVFVPSTHYVSPARERAEYDLHENRPDDPGYRRFLGRLFHPLLTRLPRRSRGLDFGSGPGPTLSVMFEECGHTVALYDLFYCRDRTVFEQRYDFITATEVIEHLHYPNRELNRLWACLQPGGFLGVMTKLVRNRDAFFSWHYKNDPTHVCFFSLTTLEYLAQSWQATLDIVADDAFIFTKTARTFTADNDI